MDYKHLGLDKNLRAKNRLASNGYMTDMERDVVVEKSPYSNPTTIIAGQTFEILTADGSGTALTYDATTGAITIGTTITTVDIQGTSITLAGTADIAGSAVIQDDLEVRKDAYFGGAASGTTKTTIYGTLDVHTPGNRTAGINSTPFRVRGAANEVIARYNFNVSNLYFYENNSNGIHENSGVEVLLADNAGANDFKVQNSDNTETFKAPSDGGLWVVPQASSPGAAAGAVYYDSNINKLKWHNGTDWGTLQSET